MKVIKVLLRVLPFLIVTAILFAVVFYPKKKETLQEEKRVVEVWNVDTFEGGKGSRTAFLAKAARRVEERNDGLYYFVSDYTLAGAEAALKEGRTPDLLSFGIGLDGFAEYSLPLSYSFAGGTLGGKCLAVPWCGGKYVLFSLKNDFEEAGSTAISCGGSNLSTVAASLAGIEGTELDSGAAYVAFLNGEYRYLLGTQRDICRFSSRGTTVYTKEISAYCDLYQYISVLSAPKRADCMLLVEELLGKETQGALSDIGMFPAQKNTRTVSVFSSTDSLREIAEKARGKADRNFIDNFLKSV